MSKSKANNFLYRMLCGAFLGISVIAPGISGSIMAVMMGIYDDLINIISNPFKKFKKNFFYLLPMALGALISMVLLIKVLDFLFENYTVPAYLLFMSLIAGSVPTVIDEAKAELNGVTLESLVVAVRVARAVRNRIAAGVLKAEDFPLLLHIDEILTQKLEVNIPWEAFTFEQA